LAKSHGVRERYKVVRNGDKRVSNSAGSGEIHCFISRVIL